jgi:hypothetical protein
MAFLILLRPARPSGSTGRPAAHYEQLWLSQLARLESDGVVRARVARLLQTRNASDSELGGVREQAGPGVLGPRPAGPALALTAAVPRSAGRPRTGVSRAMRTQHWHRQWRQQCNVECSELGTILCLKHMTLPRPRTAALSGGTTGPSHESHAFSNRRTVGSCCGAKNYTGGRPGRPPIGFTVLHQLWAGLASVTGIGSGGRPGRPPIGFRVTVFCHTGGLARARQQQIREH